MASKVNKSVLTPSGGKTLSEALDKAALGDKGLRFYSARAELEYTLSYKDLQQRAKNIAARLSVETQPNDRIGLVADTSPEFAVMFFACQYAGLLPVPISMLSAMGGQDLYKDQIRRIAKTANLHTLFAPGSMLGIIRDALKGSKLRISDLSGADLPPRKVELRPFDENELCYIQFSSGSTSSPKGIVGSQKSVTANCRAILNSLGVTSEDHVCSWLPFYHDMGLIGHFIAPVMANISVDYLSPHSFARLPSSWLKLISENKATFSYSPSFGYEISAKRWRGAHDLDLSHWRVAGIGGDMVRNEALETFASVFEPYGFSSNSYVPSYGLAESTLMVSFKEPGAQILTDEIDAHHMGMTQYALPRRKTADAESTRTFVSCGRAIADHEVKICDDSGRILSEREVGRILVRGDSVSPGLLDEKAGMVSLTDADGWLDTGDLGYWLEGEIVVTGRHKDLILWNGRNIWPQDIEWAAESVGGKHVPRTAAFELSDHKGKSDIYLLAECKSRDMDIREQLVTDMTSSVRQLVGAPVSVLLVPNRSLIMTSSGKLSRMRTRRKFVSGNFPIETPEPLNLALQPS